MNNKGLTLIEMLVAIVILGIIVMVMGQLMVQGGKKMAALDKKIVEASKLLEELKSENNEAELNIHDVYAVQFCPGYKVTYPTIFPEYGFCINDELFATYWDGSNAWTTKVVQGAYMSTSTSAPCNFRYLGHCKVGKY